MSISGGLDRAVERVRSVNGTALQLFTRNQRQWTAPELTPEEIDAFRAARAEWGDYPVAVHDSYLVNLANGKAEQAERSLAAFAEELRRVEALGIPLLVTHPGSHLGAGVERGGARYTARLDEAVERSGTSGVLVLLETTAGQGTNLGSTFEELAAIIAASKYPDRLGVCYDTCHTFAAGYDIRTPEAFDATFVRFDETVGLDRLRLLHINDSKHGLGSRKDRHEHIGEGAIGREGFRLLLADERLRRLPMVLETHKEKDLEEDRRNLRVLRELAEGGGDRPGAVF